MNQISPAEANERMKSGEITVIDVREQFQSVMLVIGTSWSSP